MKAKNFEPLENVEKETITIYIFLCVLKNWLDMEHELESRDRRFTGAIS